MWPALSPVILVLLLYVIFLTQPSHHVGDDVRSRAAMEDESSALELSSQSATAEDPCGNRGLKRLCKSGHGLPNPEVPLLSGDGDSLSQDVLKASRDSKTTAAPEYLSLDEIPLTDDRIVLDDSLEDGFNLPVRDTEDVKQTNDVNGAQTDMLKEAFVGNDYHTEMTDENSFETSSIITVDSDAPENSQTESDMFPQSQDTAATRVANRGQQESSIFRRLPSAQTSPAVTETGDLHLPGGVVDNPQNEVSSLEIKKQGRQSAHRVHKWEKAHGEANAVKALNSLRLEQMKRAKLEAELLQEEKRRAEILQQQRLEILKKARRLRSRRYVADCGLIIGRDFWRRRCWTFWSWGS